MRDLFGESACELGKERVSGWSFFSRLVDVVGGIGNVWGIGRRSRDKERLYHVAQIPPLIQKVPVHIDAIRFREIFGYQLADCRKIVLFF